MSSVSYELLPVAPEGSPPCETNERVSSCSVLKKLDSTVTWLMDSWFNSLVNQRVSSAANGRDATEGDASVSEWTINVTFGSPIPTTSYGYSPRHFRRATGEAALPIETYTDFLERIITVGKRARCQFLFLGIALYILTLFSIGDGIAVLDIFSDDGLIGPVEFILMYFSMIVWSGVLLSFSFAVWHWVSSRMIYPSMDEQFSNIVEQMGNECESSGITMGYRPYKASLWSCLLCRAKWRHDERAPTVWLRGPSDQETDEEGSNINVTVPTYPPMFISQHFPGDVHVRETEFHPNTGYDETTWALICETHKKHTGYTWPMKAMFVVLHVLPFLLLFIIFYLGFKSTNPNFEAYKGWIVWIYAMYPIVLGQFAYIYLLGRFWMVPAYKRVAEEVTQALQMEREEQGPATKPAKGMVVKFEDSPIALRPGTWSRRYELVQTHQEEDEADDLSKLV